MKRIVTFTLFAVALFSLSMAAVCMSIAWSSVEAVCIEHSHAAETSDSLYTAAQPKNLLLCSCQTVHQDTVQESDLQTGKEFVPEPVRLSFQNERSLDSLEPVLQNPAYPNGCEIASLATVLNYYGFDVTLKELDDTYLPKRGFSYTNRGTLSGGDPSKYYIGEPSSLQGGWYCFEQPLADAANFYLSAQGSTLQAQIVSGASLNDLDAWLLNDSPVIVWFTLSYNAPVRSESFFWTLESGRIYHPYTNLHCLVLTGGADGVYQLADPLRGITSVSRKTFESVYTQMGQRAIVLTETTKS